MKIKVFTLCSGYDSVGLEWSANESKPWTLEWYKRRGYTPNYTNIEGSRKDLEKKLNPETK